MWGLEVGGGLGVQFLGERQVTRVGGLADSRESHMQVQAPFLRVPGVQPFPACSPLHSHLSIQPLAWGTSLSALDAKEYFSSSHNGSKSSLYRNPWCYFVSSSLFDL